MDLEKEADKVEAISRHVRGRDLAALALGGAMAVLATSPFLSDVHATGIASGAGAVAAIVAVVWFVLARRDEGGRRKVVGDCRADGEQRLLTELRESEARNAAAQQECERLHAARYDERIAKYAEEMGWVSVWILGGDVRLDTREILVTAEVVTGAIVPKRVVSSERDASGERKPIALRTSVGDRRLFLFDTAGRWELELPALGQPLRLTFAAAVPNDWPLPKAPNSVRWPFRLCVAVEDGDLVREGFLRVWARGDQPPGVH